ncbi:MAG: tol-pal system protein YbgF [Chromatiales bacterium]|nr:tol-pal system protein YbgF [Chromatiales bacterium]
MNFKNLLGVGLLLGLMGTTAIAATIEVLPSVEQRLIKLEHQINNQALLELLDRIDSLQTELQEMRALSEEQTHQIETLKQRQRDLYLDLDRRLSRVEREGSRALPVVTPGEDGQPGSSVLVGGGEQPLVAGEGVKTIPQDTPETDALAEERAAYQKAFNLLRQLQYDPATAAFQNFIKKYPKGRYAHIAQYWLGEASYARRDFKQAIVDYQLLIDHYPQSPKLAEAMLKMGYSRWELKAVIGAKTVLDQLVSKYPDSPEAKQAQPLLEKLNRRLKK